MTDLPPHAAALGDALAALPTDSEAMVLSQLDGFVAGLNVSPVRLPVADWLPVVWGEEEPSADGGVATGLALFGSVGRLTEVGALVVEHYDDVAEVLDLSPEDYGPIYDVAVPEGGDAEEAEAGEELVWEGWVIGFQSALALQPEVWEPVLEAAEDDPARQALEVLLELYAIAVDESGLDPEAIAEMRDEAPDAIPALVLSLYAWRWDQMAAGLANGGLGAGRYRPTEPIRVTKIGRNDPCPCGSGKKYKKCCGAEG